MVSRDPVTAPVSRWGDLEKVRFRPPPALGPLTVAVKYTPEYTPRPTPT